MTIENSKYLRVIFSHILLVCLIYLFKPMTVLYNHELLVYFVVLIIIRDNTIMKTCKLLHLLPVIVTEVGKCREVVGNFGLLVPPNNPDALAEAITYYFKNPEKQKKDAFDFQQSIVKYYSNKSVLSKLIKFYKKL